MPYLDETIKQALDKGTIKPSEPGHLNYLFTKIALDYIKTNGEKYRRHNDILGALDACAKEWYRRHTAPYEDAAIKRNGDVK